MTADPTIVAEVLSCPLDDCDWTHLEPVPQVSGNTLANIFGPGVVQVVARNQYHERMERILESHHVGHKTEDYLRTITRLRAELAHLRCET